MAETVIKVENIGKKYKIGEKEKYLALRDIIVNMLKLPYKLITGKISLKKSYIWALKDVSFEVKKGEVIGIIGRNGAGKSTLLKILSRITEPSTGQITLNGRVSSLLEVGTGFHPELTGRENIYLNGAILGMTKKEIKRKFNDIVEFSGIEQFLDTPVKRYSSGMYVRLAFSVAAHLEPEILLVDEVLAVGDAEFQKKCLGKMKDVAEGGRTVLFVSHNMGAVRNLCERCILLENNTIGCVGETKEIINRYMNNNYKLATYMLLKDRKDRKGEGDIIFTDIKIVNYENSQIIKSGDKLKIILKYISNFQQNVSGIRVVISIVNQTGEIVLRLDSEVTNESFNIIKPKGEIICQTGQTNLISGIYSVNINIMMNNIKQDHIIDSFLMKINNNNQRYNYKINPEKNICNNLITYSFKNNK